ncbi:hypothetical protein BKA70DRAFT_1297110 [Coprinopsis sp. MPI-PUGE-AT-0042]|nr:hypothetical protein BKA70DRAFT_1297110 [Coprinopsis sp. MPI-PUGE-AT-0042]
MVPGSARRCLDLPEILDLIFGHAKEDASDDKNPCSSLVSVARTSKILHEAAIRHIWAELPCLEVILALFPNDTFKLERDSRPGFMFNNTKKKSYFLFLDGRVPERAEQGFTRLGHYAPHVRSVKVHNPDDDAKRFHYSALQAIYLHEACPKPLFPNLHTTALPCHSVRPLEPVFYPALLCSAGSRVRNLTVASMDVMDIWGNMPPMDGGEPPATRKGYWDAVAGRIANIAPQLKSFVLEHQPFPRFFGGPRATGGPEQGERFVGWIPALSASFSQFSPSLEHLDIVPLVMDVSVLASLARLTHLKTLRISLLDCHVAQGPFNLLGRTKGSLHLPDLQYLFVHLSHTTQFFALLHLLQAKKLSKLHLEFALPEDVDLAPLFARLLADGFNDHLQEITISKWYPELSHNTWDREVFGPRFTVGKACIRPLLAFSKLSSLSIRPCHVRDLYDKDLEKLFASWPSLVKFELDDEHFECVLRSDFTLQGVQHALQHAPKLQELCIRFDGSVIPKEPTKVHTSLKSLDVLSSMIASGAEFVEWMNVRYPSVSSFKAFTRYRKALEAVYVYHEGSPHEDEDREDIDSYALSAVMLDRWNDVCVHVDRR